MDTIKIGKFLAELRRERELTQEQLAEKLGTSNKTISRWENGNYMPPVEMLMELSEFYGVSINELLSGRRLDESETRSAAEENLKNVLEQNAFSVADRIWYFTQKWKRDHAAALTLEMFAITAVIFIGIFVWRYAMILGIFWALAFTIGHYNQMMAYVEKHAFDIKSDENEKKS